jgi:hypothetical protein
MSYFYFNCTTSFSLIQTSQNGFLMMILAAMWKSSTFHGPLTNLMVFPLKNACHLILQKQVTMMKNAAQSTAFHVICQKMHSFT